MPTSCLLIVRLQLFKAIDLPYSKDALAPYISAETLEFHYEKHHKGYVTKLNEFAASDANLQNKSLEEVVKTSTGKIFNNAAQIWNHDFYWQCLAPKAGGNPTGKIAEAIEKSFGSFENFQKKFDEAAVTHFGSGWAWLVREQNSNDLSILSLHDADNPIVHGKVAVLTCDVWEHAYYIDYRNARPKYMEAFWKLVNWEFANKRLL